MALTQEQIVTLRRQLEEERASLTTNIDKTQTGFVDADSEYERGEFAEPSNHPADTATETFDQEHQLAIENMLDDTQRQVEHALARMDEGTYGICEDCGEEIPFERLAILPRATRCIRCQARYDEQHSATAFGSQDSRSV